MNQTIFLLLTFSFLFINYQSVAQAYHAEALQWEQTTCPGDDDYGGIATNRSGAIFVSTIMAGLSGSSAWRSTNHGATWDSVNQFMVVGAFDDSLVVGRSNYFDQWTRSTNNGSTWSTWSDPRPMCAVSGFEKKENGMIFAGQVGVAIQLFATPGGVLVSSDSGRTWLATGLYVDRLQIVSICINQQGHLFAGEKILTQWGFHGGIHRSTDNGVTWVFRNPNPLVTWNSINALAVHSTGAIIAGSDHGIYISTDDGENWERNPGINEDTTVLSLAVNSLGHVFAGTRSRGVFVSSDGGLTWSNESAGLTNLTIPALAVATDGVAYAVTSNGRVFRTRQSTTTAQSGEGRSQSPSEIHLYQNYPNPFNPATVIAYDLPRSSHVVLSVLDLLGRRVAVLVDDSQQLGRHEAVFEGNNFSTGVYVYQLSTNGRLLTQKMLLMK